MSGYLGEKFSSSTRNETETHGADRLSERAGRTKGDPMKTKKQDTVVTATITQTVKASSAAAVVGKCATAIGTADSTGAIAARSIAISNPTASGCTRTGRGGFGGGFGGGGNGGGAGGTGSGTTNG